MSNDKSSQDTAPLSTPAPCRGCGEVQYHLKTCTLVDSFKQAAYGRSPVLDSERAQPLAPQCEHSISLTKDYKGPTADCPIHGKPLAEPRHEGSQLENSLGTKTAHDLSPKGCKHPRVIPVSNWLETHTSRCVVCGEVRSDCDWDVQVAEPQGEQQYDPDIDINRDPRCDCIHPESKHDPETGKCLSVNPTFGPCPCKGEVPQGEHDDYSSAPGLAPMPEIRKGEQVEPCCVKCGHRQKDPRRRGSDEYNSFCIYGCGCDCEFTTPEQVEGAAVPEQYICIDESEAPEVFDWLNSVSDSPEIGEAHFRLCFHCQEAVAAMMAVDKEFRARVFERLKGAAATQPAEPPTKTKCYACKVGQHQVCIDARNILCDCPHEDGIPPFEVLKITAKDGRVFFKRVKWQKFELIRMTYEEYRDIPTTQEAEKIFRL